MFLRNWAFRTEKRVSQPAQCLLDKFRRSRYTERIRTIVRYDRQGSTAIGRQGKQLHGENAMKHAKHSVMPEEPAIYVPPAQVWPADGKRLAEVASPYGFLPVTEEILAEITRRIVEHLRPEKVILFGSYAYGKPTADSDVDFLVVMETSLRPAIRTLAVCRLIRPRPFPVDIIVKTPAEIESALANNDWFLSRDL